MALVEARADVNAANKVCGALKEKGTAIKKGLACFLYCCASTLQNLSCGHYRIELGRLTMIDWRHTGVRGGTKGTLGRGERVGGCGREREYCGEGNKPVVA